jgi:hypothetical protein
MAVSDYQNQKINKNILKQKRILNLLNRIEAKEKNLPNFLHLKPDVSEEIGHISK